jgi:hypothetical protein
MMPLAAMRHLVTTRELSCALLVGPASARGHLMLLLDERASFWCIFWPLA